MTNDNPTYLDWVSFQGAEIPSSLSTYPTLYDSISRFESPKVLDIGSGFGKTCFEIASNTSATVHGIDINPSGVEYSLELRQQMPHSVRSRLSFSIGDALSLPFPDSSFNVVVMQALMTTLTSPLHRSMALSEARRVTKNIGGLYVSDFIQTWHIKSRYDRYMVGLEESGELGSFFAYNESKTEREYQAHHYSEKELVDLLNNAGFEIRIFDYHKFLSRTNNVVNGAVIWAD